MKKLIQALIIVVLVFTLFQAASGVSIAFADTACTNGTQSSCLLTTASAQTVQVLTCLSNHVFCVTPNVGWNT